MIFTTTTSLRGLPIEQVLDGSYEAPVRVAVLDGAGSSHLLRVMAARRPNGAQKTTHAATQRTSPRSLQSPPNTITGTFETPLRWRQHRTSSASEVHDDGG